MNKRYNNVEMLKANIERIHTAPYYAQMARNLMAKIGQQERMDGILNTPQIEDWADRKLN